MNILIVYPSFQKSLWSFTDAFRLGTKNHTIPPRELLIASILLPITWERKLIDLNTEKLKKNDIIWADYVLLSAKEEQYKSTIKIIEKSKSFGRKIVASGSLFTEYYEEFDNVDHLVLDDINLSLPLFINDIENDKPKKVYHSNPFFEIRKITESNYSLANISSSLSQNIQLSHA
jgi:hypothetical protein